MNKIIVALTGLVFLLAACNKIGQYSTFPLSDYNLQVPGKYITYQMDSLLFINFGSKDTIISYFVKDSVEALVTDSLGEKGYRILRFIRQSDSAVWVPNNTFITIPTTNTIDYIENNLRYVILSQPLVNGYSWQGNSYIDTYDANSGIVGLNDWDLTYMNGWNYTYSNVNQPLTVGSSNLDSTVTVNQVNQTDGDSTNAAVYSDRIYSIEQYAKGIGLVYRNFYYRVYQPATPNNTSPAYSSGYGVLMVMIDHN